MEQANPEVDNVYTLCSNTVFDIGVDDEEGNCCVDGMSRLYARNRTHIKCGGSGSSNNNCTIMGGQIQLLSRPQTFGETASTAVIFQGITFEAAEDTGVLLGNGGDITFVDCIFKNHVNRAAVLALYRGPRGGRSRDLSRTSATREKTSASIVNLDDARGNSRALQGLEVAQVIVFRDCLFTGNQQGVSGLPLTQRGVVSSITEFNPIIFQNCIFTNNTFDAVDGYAIATGGSSLSISDSCVYENSFAGFGAIQSYGGGTTQSLNNYASDNGNDTLVCSFIATSGAADPESQDELTCINADTDTCAASIASTPSAMEAQSSTGWDDPIDTPIQDLTRTTSVDSTKSVSAGFSHFVGSSSHRYWLSKIAPSIGFFFVMFWR